MTAPDVVAFLKARLDEDEAWANESGDRTTTTPESQSHVLADVAAKRAIIAEVESWPHQANAEVWVYCPLSPETRRRFPDDWDSDGVHCTCGRDRRAGRILFPLAAVYAWHEDHREEWKP